MSITTLTSTAQYSGLYRKLPNSRSIRVLDIEAPSDPRGIDQPIHGRLRVINLDEHPAFTALSYVWGEDLVNVHAIQCGSFALPITANGFSAVHHLRDTLGEFTIWIDAICINQADEKEKAQQIPLMGDIYSRAQTVYVWLGQGNTQSDRAMKYLASAGLQEKFAIAGTTTRSSSLRSDRFGTSRTVFAYAAALWSMSLSLSGLLDDVFPSTNANTVIRPLRFLHFWRTSSRDHASCKDLESLLKRDWMERVWTYQEILLASNPVVVCGHSHLSWSRFASAILFLEYYGITYGRINLITPIVIAWARVVFAHARLLTEDEGTLPDFPISSSNTHLITLQEYQSFLYQVERMNTVLRVGGIGLTIISTGGVFIILSWLLPALYIDWYEAKRGIVWVYSCLLIVFLGLLLLAFSSLFQSIPPAIHMTTATDNLVDGVCSRKARNPKDKAFGVQAVLQKLLQRPLPPPDYQLSNGQIYKEMSVCMVRATNSLDLLLPAAQKRLDGQPSWVPDWSAEFSPFWKYDPVDVNPFTLHQPEANVRESVHRRATVGSDSAWRWSSERSDILTVRGCVFHNIASCLTFSRTEDDNFDIETTNHLHNIQSINTLFRRFSHKWGFARFFKAILPVQVLEERGFDIWLSFFSSTFTHRQTPSTILSILKGEAPGRFGWIPGVFGIRPSVRHRTIRTQIRVCNALADGGNTLFITDSVYESHWFNRHRRRSEPHFGVGMNDVCFGDKIVVIAGFSCPLIVRQDETLTKLISPAKVLNIRDYNEARTDELVTRLQEEDLEDFDLS